MPHIDLASGWSVRVFNDFSDGHTYVPVDFVDPPEMYSNEPTSMFVMSPPYPSALAVLAGRDVIEMTSSSYAVHRVGATTTPNQGGIPDHLTSGVLVPGPNPLVMLSSSSATQGDGTFVMTTQWQTSADFPRNNTRCVTVDAAGGFDDADTLTGEIYLGTDNGVVRRSDMMTLFIGDTKTMKVVGTRLLLTRQIIVGDVRLVLVDSKTGGMYPETELARAGGIEIGEGEPPAPGIAWAILDTTRLVSVTAMPGAMDAIAQITDPAFVWSAVAAPPAGHPLSATGSEVYVLESHRDSDLDRVLVFTSP